MNTCLFLADVADEVNSVCDEDLLARKVNDVVVLLEGMHKWEHQNHIMELSPGQYDLRNVIEVLDSDICYNDLLGRVLACDYRPAACAMRRWGNTGIVPAKAWYALRKRTVIDWTDCSAELPFDDAFLAALRYGAAFMLEGDAKKTAHMMISNQIFQQLLTSAKEATDKVFPIRGIATC